MVRAGCIPAVAVVLLTGREQAVRCSEYFAGRAVVPVEVVTDGKGRAVVPVGAVTDGKGRAVVPVGRMPGTHDSGPASGRGGTTSQGRNCDRGRSWYARLPFGRIRQLGGVPAGEAVASGPPLYKVPRTGGVPMVRMSGVGRLRRSCWKCDPVPSLPFVSLARRGDGHCGCPIRPWRPGIPCCLPMEPP